MPKPTTLPRWSDVDPATTTTEPSSGEKDTGFVASTPAVSEYVNWLFYHLYLWIAFLDSIFTTDGGISTPSNEHIEVTGNGEFCHAGEHLALAAIEATILSNWTATAPYIISSGAGTAIKVIPLKHGDNIESVDISRYGEAPNTADVQATLYAVSNGTATNIGDVAITNPAASWGNTQLVVGVVGGVGTPTPHALVSGEALYLYLVANAAGVRVQNLTANYTHPTT